MMKTKEQIQEALAAFRLLLAEYKHHIRMQHHLRYENSDEILIVWRNEIASITQLIDAFEYVLGYNNDGYIGTVVQNTFSMENE